MEPQTKKFCLFTRSFQENPYLDFFISYYVKLGFHQIILLKSDEFPYQVPQKYVEYVTIVKVLNLANKLLPKYDYLLKKTRADWTLVVDVDEFLILPKAYTSIGSYVNSKLPDNPDINVFYFRWAMVEKYDQQPESTLQDIFTNYKWFSNHHIKSFVKNQDLKKISHPHLCQLTKPMVCYFEGEITNIPKPNHHELKATSYEDAFILHLHTRSLNNLTVKALSTQLNQKKINNKAKLRQLVEQLDQEGIKTTSYSPDILFSLYQEYIGNKATLPYRHSEHKSIQLTLQDYYIPDFTSPLINQTIETKELQIHLKHHKINYLKYQKLIGIIDEIVKLTKIFHH